jgi:predicted transcriptional regulator
MSTTSLKLPDELKLRAVSAAQTQGLSPHAFMVQAIEQAASAAERRHGFVAVALAAREQLQATGKAYDADEVHAYLKARVQGCKDTKPKAKSWRG